MRMEIKNYWGFGRVLLIESLIGRLRRDSRWIEYGLQRTAEADRAQIDFRPY